MFLVMFMVFLFDYFLVKSPNGVFHFY